MYDKPSFYLKAFLVAGLSSVFFIGCVGLFFYAGLKNSNFMGGMTRDPTLTDNLMFYSSIFGMFLAIAICPVFAIVNRNEIAGITKNDQNASILFIAVCFFPAVLVPILFVLLFFAFPQR